jgi:hypothetical protein
MKLQVGQPAPRWSELRAGGARHDDREPPERPPHSFRLARSLSAMSAFNDCDDIRGIRVAVHRYAGPKNVIGLKPDFMCHVRHELKRRRLSHI